VKIKKRIILAIFYIMSYWGKIALKSKNIRKFRYMGEKIPQIIYIINSKYINVRKEEVNW